MVWIRIRLVGGEEDKICGEIDLDPQINVNDLMKKIESVTRIPLDFQEIQFRGNELADVEQPLEEIKFGEELVVKHARLSQWTSLLELEVAFHQTHEEEQKKSIYEDAKKLIEVLTASKFFLVYPGLGTRRFAMENKFLIYFGRSDTCRAYFTKVYGEKIKVTFGIHDEDLRYKWLCTLDDGSTITKFYVNKRVGAENSSSNIPCDIDIKELFVYTFLEKLKMGAQIQFINPEPPVKWIIYIASKHIRNFKTLATLERTQPEDLQQYSKSVAEMLFVYSVLMLGDAHINAMGFDSALNPFITEPYVKSRARPLTCVGDFCDYVQRSNKFNEVLGSFDERLKISKEFLQNSNFSDVFERSIESFLQNHKSKFDEKKMDDFLEYVEKVRNNVKLFVDHSASEK